ncbi:conjugal transfer protein TraG [Azospirillum sp. B21]|nr:conjugal transfer protein TraG [Azospirillum sp. B21]
MTMSWTIYSIGDSAWLEQVLNSLAMLTGAGTFAGMGRIGMLIGIILALVQAIITNRINIGQTVVALILFSGLYGTTTTVTVYDIYSGRIRVVANVPGGVAIAGSVISTLGERTTSLMEQAFSTPRMTSYGFVAPLVTLKEVATATIKVPAGLGAANSYSVDTDWFRSWQNYVADCTKTKISNYPSQLTDIMLTSTPAASLKFQDVNHGTMIFSGGEQALDCTAAHQELLRMNQAFLPGFKDRILAAKLTLPPEEPRNAASVTSQIQMALDSLGLAVSADEFIIASLLERAYSAGMKQAAQLDQAFALATSIDDAAKLRATAWDIEAGLFMKSWRPMLTAIEGFLYAVTPFLPLTIFFGMAGIKIAAQYLMTLVWVWTWMPVLAIVNNYACWIVQEKASLLSGNGTSATSFVGMLQFESVVRDWLGYANYMAASIPMLAGMVIGMGGMKAWGAYAMGHGKPNTVDPSEATPRTMQQAPLLQMGGAYSGTYSRGDAIIGEVDAKNRLPLSSLNSLWDKATSSSQRAVETAQTSVTAAASQALKETWGKNEDGGWRDLRTVASNFERSNTFSGVKDDVASVSDQLRRVSGRSEQDVAAIVAGASVEAAAGLEVGGRKAAGQRGTTESSVTSGRGNETSTTTRVGQPIAGGAGSKEQATREFSGTNSRDTKSDGTYESDEHSRGRSRSVTARAGARGEIGTNASTERSFTGSLSADEQSVIRQNQARLAKIGRAITGASSQGGGTTFLRGTGLERDDRVQKALAEQRTAERAYQEATTHRGSIQSGVNPDPLLLARNLGNDQKSMGEMSQLLLEMGGLDAARQLAVQHGYYERFGSRRDGDAAAMMQTLLGDNPYAKHLDDQRLADRSTVALSALERATGFAVRGANLGNHQDQAGMADRVNSTTPQTGAVFHRARGVEPGQSIGRAAGLQREVNMGMKSNRRMGHVGAGELSTEFNAAVDAIRTGNQSWVASQYGEQAPRAAEMAVDMTSQSLAGKMAELPQVISGGAAGVTDWLRGSVGMKQDRSFDELKGQASQRGWTERQAHLFAMSGGGNPLVGISRLKPEIGAIASPEFMAAYQAVVDEAGGGKGGEAVAKLVSGAGALRDVDHGGSSNVVSFYNRTHGLKHAFEKAPEVHGREVDRSPFDGEVRVGVLPGNAASDADTVQRYERGGTSRQEEGGGELPASGEGGGQTNGTASRSAERSDGGPGTGSHAPVGSRSTGQPVAFHSVQQEGGGGAPAGERGGVDRMPNQEGMFTPGNGSAAGVRGDAPQHDAQRTQSPGHGGNLRSAEQEGGSGASTSREAAGDRAVPAAHADRAADGGGPGSDLSIATSEATAGSGAAVEPTALSGSAAGGARQQETRSDTEEVDRVLQQDAASPLGDGSRTGR